MESLKKKLFKAIKNGKTDTVQALLLSQGLDVNSKTFDGETPLHLAVLALNEKMVQFLIDQGADVSLKNGAGETPMQWAMTKYKSSKKGFKKFKFVSLLKSLLEAGADVNSRGSSHSRITPLLCAADMCAPKLAKYLVEKGADVNVKDGFGCTALYVTAYWCDEYPQQATMLLEVLLEAHANPNERDEDGSTALHILVYSIDRGMWPPIEREQISKIIKLFFKHGADFNARDENDMTPMELACIKDNAALLNYDLIESLIQDGGVDVNSKISTGDGDIEDEAGMSLLHRACESLSLPLVKFLLKNRADLESKTDQGETPLLYAIKSCSYYGVNSPRNLIRYLLKKGANINVCSPDNENILSYVQALTPDLPEVWSEDENGRALWKTILEHIAKELCLERLVEKHLLGTIARNSKYRDYLEKCLQEMVSLNETRFMDSWLTPGDLLIKDKKSLALYAENPSLVSKFHEIHLGVKFPIYGPTIELRFHKAIYHQKIIESAALALTSFLAYPLPSDHLVIRGIFKYCSIKDLKNLALASSSESSFNQEPC